MSNENHQSRTQDLRGLRRLVAQGCGIWGLLCGLLSASVPVPITATRTYPDTAHGQDETNPANSLIPIREVHVISDEVLDFLMVGEATYHGDQSWMEDFHKLFTNALKAMNVLSYTWVNRVSPVPDNHFRVYYLTGLSTVAN